jgi:Protein of unknown function (DUF1553)/Protein of unknown function (DUF1549)
MGAARICPRCMVLLVTNADHSLIWCPQCKRQIRLLDHSKESVAANHPHRHAGSPHPKQVPPPLPPTPPVESPAPALPKVRGNSPPICTCHVHHRGRHYLGHTAVLALVGLFSTALVAGGLGLAIYLAGPGQQKSTAITKTSPAPVEPVHVANPRPQQKQPAPGPAPVSTETREAKALRAVFQQSGSNLSTGTKVVEGARQIDELVLAGLKAREIAPAALCSDAVFVRRVYLDVIGRIPTAEEAKQFLEDKDPDRRGFLIDRLLVHRDFADYWTMKWCDLLRVKSEFPINLWPNAVQAYHRWIRTGVRDNLPYDQFARELLTSSGSNFRDPPANFYRAVQKKDPSNIARAVALTFMGVRPEGWPKERWAGMETFFSQVGYKQTAEWKEEVVFFDTTRSLKVEDAIFPDGTRATIEADQDPREVFADWLIDPKNPWFTRNIANRAWSWLVGRGIIHEVDDIRPDNPPSNPELLAHLEQELIRAKYDLRRLYRVILNSKTYQASSIPASKHPEAAALFAYYPVRRLEAEVLIDAICQVTGTTEKYSSPIPEPFTYIPESHRSISLADASITSPFLEMFGRPSRDTGLESERNNNFTAAQKLHLLNSAHVHEKIQNGPGMQQFFSSGSKLEEIADQLYLTILSRYPTEGERAVMADYRSGGGGRRPALDIAWALMNTAEFLCRH